MSNFLKIRYTDKIAQILPADYAICEIEEGINGRYAIIFRKRNKVESDCFEGEDRTSLKLLNIEIVSEWRE